VLRAFARPGLTGTPASGPRARRTAGWRSSATNSECLRPVPGRAGATGDGRWWPGTGGRRRWIRSDPLTSRPRHGVYAVGDVNSVAPQGGCLAEGQAAVAAGDIATSTASRPPPTTTGAGLLHRVGGGGSRKVDALSGRAASGRDLEGALDRPAADRPRSQRRIRRCYSPPTTGARADGQAVDSLWTFRSGRSRAPLPVPAGVVAGRTTRALAHGSRGSGSRAWSGNGNDRSLDVGVKPLGPHRTPARPGVDRDDVGVMGR